MKKNKFRRTEYRQLKKEHKQFENKEEETLLHQKILGTYHKNRNFGFVVSLFKKLPTDIYISKRNDMRARNDQKVLVEIIKLPIGRQKLEGRIVKVIGNEDTREIEMKCLIAEYDVPEKFPVEVINEANSISQKIDKTECSYREDFRNKVNIFTIDGEDSKDLDDAVSVKKLKNGNIELGVYIADVSFYVKAGSEIDKEAINRGTSIYMLDRVIPMLPVQLSNGICSLNAGEDRFVLAVIMNINKDGKIIKSRITKGIINVNERMTYTNVAKILDSSDAKVLKRYKKYIKDFKLMEDLALKLKNRRDKNGSLNLNIPETKIVFDNKGKVIDIKKYELTFANQIIEQFMLTANEVVAETYNKIKAPFIYRVHETPDVDKVEELNKFLFDLGYKIKIGEEDEISPMEYAKILNDIEGTEQEKVISTFILRTLKIARYESENKGHFGIASKFYCHFTSPIRRYPDLFIHRVISAYLANNSEIEEKRKAKFEKQASKYAEKSSEREKIAQTIEREAEDIKKAEFMEDKIGEIYDGIISGITSFGVFVELENTVEGLIRFEYLGNDFYAFDENKKILIGEYSGKVYKIGDKIKVKVIEANKLLRRISFECVE